MPKVPKTEERFQELMLEHFIKDPKRESRPSEVQLKKTFIERMPKFVPLDLIERFYRGEIKAGDDIMRSLLMKRFEGIDLNKILPPEMNKLGRPRKERGA